MKKILIILITLILLALLTVLLITDKGDNLEDYVNSYNGVYQADDGNIISLYSYHGKEAFLENVAPISSFIENCPLDTYVVIPPRKMDALTDSLPKDLKLTEMKKLFKLAEKEIKKSGGTYIDLLEALEKKSEFAGHLYFKTDHHWTSKGAYLAYREIVNAMGETPLEEDAFEIKLGSDKYRGSDYTKSPNEDYDEIYLYYSKSYSDYEVTSVAFPYDSDENNLTLSGMYLEDKLTSWDPYTVYFGGNTPYVTITKGNRETLLIIRDSFASALAPFLAEHFNIVMIDPRFYPDSLSSLIKREGVDKVLIVENMGSLTENKVKFKY